MQRSTTRAPPASESFAAAAANNSLLKTKRRDGDKDSESSERKKPRGPFASNVMGTPIVNAITGVKYPWTVGSFEENYLWKVANCMYTTPDLYFYDSPEQYEAFRKVEMEAESKELWHALQKNLS